MRPKLTTIVRSSKSARRMRDLVQRRPHRLVERLPCFGKPYGPCRAVREGNSKALFQRTKSLAHRGFMRGTVMYGAGDVRVENVPEPELKAATDAIVRVTHACICGSDLWPYNLMSSAEAPRPMGHEAVGV